MKQITITLMVLMGLIAAVMSASAYSVAWTNYNNVTVPQGAFDDTGVGTFNGSVSLWPLSATEAFNRTNYSAKIIVDRKNTSVLGNYVDVTVTYNLSSGGDNVVYNITEIDFGLMGNNVNVTASTFTTRWNRTNATTGATSVSDVNGDGWYTANFTFTHNEGSYENSQWRIPPQMWYGATSLFNGSSNITLTQRVYLKVETSNLEIVRLGGTNGAGIYVIGLGATGNQQMVLVNHSFNISLGSPFINESVNVTYYPPIRRAVSNASIQVFWDNETFGGSVFWFNWTGNRTIKADGNLVKWNFSLGYGLTRNTPAGVSSNDTTNWRVQYAIPGPWMSQNTTIKAGLDSRNPNYDGWDVEFRVSMNNTEDAFTDLHAFNVTLKYDFNDELYDSDFKLQVWNDNTSRWVDITPSYNCKTDNYNNQWNQFAVYGEIYRTCLTDSDNDDKPDSVNVTIPRLSENKFKITASVTPGKTIIYPSVIEVCGNGKCETNEFNLKTCPSDCAGATQPVQTTSYLPQAAKPLLTLTPMQGGIIILIILLLLMMWGGRKK